MTPENPSRTNAIAKEIEAKAFETQDLLKARKLEKAKTSLKEIDTLIKELSTYRIKINPEFQKIINTFKDMVEGRKTIEEAFNVKIGKQNLPERYVEDWKAQEKVIIDFANTKIRNQKYSSPKDINTTIENIEKFTTEVDEIAIDKSFSAWIRNGLYAELYKAIKQNLGNTKLSTEMEIAVSYVLDQALVFNEEESDEKNTEKASTPKIDPLFIYSGRLNNKFKLSDPSTVDLSGTDFVTGEDFMEGIEKDSLPQDVSDDLNDTLKELGNKAKTANPWQEALINLFAVYVIKPVYQLVKESADISIIKYPVRKILLSVRTTIGKIFATPATSEALIRYAISIIRTATSGLSDLGLKIILDDKFAGATDSIIKIAKNMEANNASGYLTEVILRDPKAVAEERLSQKSNITRLSALTYLLIKLKEENKENKGLLIGVQFAIQVLIRLHDDDELLQASPFIRNTVKDLLSTNKTTLSETPLANEVGESEIDVALRMIFPDTQKSITEKPNTLNHQKVEKLLLLVEDLLIKDPENYSKYNALIVCLIENIREYLNDKNAAGQLSKDWKTLRGLIVKIANEKGVTNPYVKLVLDNPELVNQSIETFYKEPKKSGKPETASGKQLARLKTILAETAKENTGNKEITKGLELVILILEGFSNDQDFFTHIEQFEKVLDTVLFNKEFVNLKLSGAARATLKSLIGYAPIRRAEPDMKIVARIAGVFGNFEQFATKPIAETQKRALTLMKNVPQALKLNFAISGLNQGLKYLVGKIVGDKFGPKEQAIFDYLLANYRDYLCDKYDNDIEKFLLEFEAGPPPKFEVKTANIKMEAKMFAQISKAAIIKIGIPEIAGMIEENLILLANTAKETLKKRRGIG